MGKTRTPGAFRKRKNLGPKAQSTRPLLGRAPAPVHSILEQDRLLFQTEKDKLNLYGWASFFAAFLPYWFPVSPAKGLG
jgi:hypothetical protein